MNADEVYETEIPRPGLGAGLEPRSTAEVYTVGGITEALGVSARTSDALFGGEYVQATAAGYRAMIGPVLDDRWRTFVDRAAQACAVGVDPRGMTLAELRAFDPVAHAMGSADGDQPADRFETERNGAV